MDPQQTPPDDQPTVPPTPPPATDQPPDTAAPAAPADDQSSGLPADHPLTDSNVDDHQAYDEGTAGAAGAGDQSGSPTPAAEPPVEDATAQNSDTVL